MIAPGMPNPTIAQNLGPTPGDLLAKDTAANVTVLPIQNGMETRHLKIIQLGTYPGEVSL
jgi:hypothetical protein